ncbi:hypothetical protein EGW08_013110 [Elysia chlorotica]|uniref:Urease accessory protein UreF n=1 Tax=Elysia chlorotica TaxID=188477 RepID=A0A433TBZ2_ELYCH|nr:hypothetical protein EGW08_013110 [Elysia chlorotica]
MSSKMDQRQLFALLQLTDSAFPIGGFSHSLGLETFTQHYLVSRKKMEPEALLHALICIIENSGSLSLPFVRAAYNVIDKHNTAKDGRQQNPPAVPKAVVNSELNGQKTESLGTKQEANEKLSFAAQSLVQLDKLYEACSSNHIAKRASTRQGRSLLEASLYTFPDLARQGMGRLSIELPHCHHAVLHGTIMAGLGLGLEDAVSSFMFGIVRTLVATAVRLDALGAMEAQRVQWKLHEICADVIKRNKSKPVDEACVKFPVLDILQNTQDKLFAKLFYS